MPQTLTVPLLRASPPDTLSIRAQIQREVERMQREQRQQILESRRTLARRVWRLRGLTRARVGRGAQRELTTRMLQLEQQHQATTQRLKLECAELALSTVQAVLPELAEMPAAIAERITRGVAQLARREKVMVVVGGEISAAAQQQIGAAVVERFPEVALSLELDTALPAGVVLLRTPLGEVQLDWHREFQSVAAQVRGRIYG